MKKSFFAVVCMLVYACSNDISMLLPPGPEGQKGADGKSAYDVWVAAVGDGTIDWDEATDLPGFFRYLKGEDGKSAYDQWVDDVTSDEGLDNPHTPETDRWPDDETDMDDFYRYLMGEDGIDGGPGPQGDMPVIGPDGNWWIGDENTGVKAEGTNGLTPRIDPNTDTWWIGTTNTGVPATGPAGLSAYDLWKADVAKGLDNPHTPAVDEWTKTETSMADFYRYLTGASGLTGVPGLPGTPGANGESAYDYWKDMVEDGTVDWDEGTDPDDFFRYLKGKDGANGIDGVDGLDGAAGENGTDGIDGIDGMTAYDLWKNAVASEQGLEDPHNPGKAWDKTKTAMNDFYRYMTGKDGSDGISAYGQWVLDVRSEEGLDNPHTAEVDTWPKDQTTLMDFWHYLRGEDGETPPPPVVNPGQPGAEIEPDPGKYNVIALYKDRDHSEYVSPADGSVLYQVWLPNGNKAGADVEVADMPGIPDVTFKTLADGTIKVAKEYLPTSGTTAERFGAPTITGSTEPVAVNTYVPQRIDVRLLIGNSTYLVPELIAANTNELNGGNYMSVPIKAQRRVTSEGQWEDLPAYMTDINRTVRAYEVTEETLESGQDPTAPNMNVMLLHRSNAAQDLRGATVSVRRPTMPVSWMLPATQMEKYYMVQNNPALPNYTPGMFTMVLDDDTGFYGENPHTRAIILTTPVNFHPLPSQLEMTVASASTLHWKSVTFDVTGIDESLLLAARYGSYDMQATNGQPYTLYTRGNAANDNKCFALNFGTGTTLIGGTGQASVEESRYEFTSTTPVVIGSDVYLRPTSILIAGPGNATRIGRLIEIATNKYAIHAEPPFVFSDILITIIP